MSVDDFELHQKQKADAILDMPLRGVVTSVFPEKETYKISSYAASGEASMVVRHPFLGVNSWIRAIGEPGTTVLVQQRGDIRQQEIWGYISNKTSGLLKKALVDETVAYRVLQPGEIEIMSSGKASAFFGNLGDLELKGGALNHSLLQTEAEIASAAPTHRRTWWKNAPSTLGHEERVGIVKRPNPLWPNTQSEPVKLPNNSYALEYSRWINDDTGSSMVVTQEGNVINQLGTTVKQLNTGKDLRYRKEISGVAGGTLTFEVDQELNTSLLNSSQAKETKINLGANNEITWFAKKWTAQVTDSGKLVFTRSLAITSQQIQVNSSNVVFGPTGLEPIILGSTFINGVMTPLVGALLAAFTTLANDPVTTPPVLKAVSASLAPVMSSVQSAIAACLSTQVRLSG